MKRGFIALISVIIISAILLLLTTTLSYAGYSGRFNISDSELKEKSYGLAEACMDQAILKLANDPTYNPTNEVVPFDADSCTIKDITIFGSQKIIRTQAIYKNYYSNLKITINSSTLDIDSVEELPTI